MVEHSFRKAGVKGSNPFIGCEVLMLKHKQCPLFLESGESTVTTYNA